MAVKILKKTEVEAVAPTAKALNQAKPGQARRLPLDDVCFDKPQRLRIGHLMTIFQVSPAQIFKMRAANKIPEPAGHMGTGVRPTPYWLTTQIRPFIEGA